MTHASALTSISGKIVAHTFHSGVFMFVLQHPTTWNNDDKQNFMSAVMTTQPHMCLVCGISKPTTNTHRKHWSANKQTPPCESIAIELLTMKSHVKCHASMQCQWSGCYFPLATLLFASTVVSRTVCNAFRCCVCHTACKYTVLHSWTVCRCLLEPDCIVLNRIVPSQTRRCMDAHRILHTKSNV